MYLQGRSLRLRKAGRRSNPRRVIFLVVLIFGGLLLVSLRQQGMVQPLFIPTPPPTRIPQVYADEAEAVTLILCGLAENSLPITMLLFLICFAALGAGNGALFQLVPLRWPLTTAVAGSMIGEIGALGGGLIPNAMGMSKQYAGTYLWGFIGFAACAAVMLILLRRMQIRWTRTWAEKGGRARA